MGTLISGKISTLTLFFQEVLPCFQELVIVCSRKLQLLLLLQSKLRLSHLLRGNIRYGSVVQFLHLYLRSKVCGLVRRSMTSQVLLLSIANVSKNEFKFRKSSFYRFASSIC